MWVTYQQLNRAGLKQAQRSVRPIYERASVVRAYQSRTFPGLIQTAAFMPARTLGKLLGGQASALAVL